MTGCETDKLVNGRRVARHLDVTPSAVSNWLKRGTLPGHLKPLESGPDSVPLWPESSLPAFLEWHSSKKGVRNRQHMPAGDPSLKKLLEYVLVMKRANAVRGHQGLGDDDFYMGKAAAYQDVENLIRRKLG